MDDLADRGSNCLSTGALQRRLERQAREQIDQLCQKLELAEEKLLESNKLNARLSHDVEVLTRGSKIYEKKCSELQKDVQKTRAQLEATVRVKSGVSVNFGQKRTHSPAKKVQNDEIRMWKTALERSQKEVEECRKKEQELEIKVKVLEDALEFRVEEIGLSGHADLLAKVASLRGEVSSLKSELEEKIEKMEEAETDRKNARSSEESLHRQISLLQQKYNQSQEDLQRLKVGDIHSQLAAVEQERDVLLDFIQVDMEKSSVLGQQLEALQSEYRTTKQEKELAQQRLDYSSGVLETLQTKCKDAETERTALKIKVSELSRTVELAKDEASNSRNLLERKSLEVEELTRIHLSLMDQLKSRDKERDEVEQELRTVRAKCEEFRLSTPSLQSELESLRSRLSSREQELQVLRETSHQLEPRLASLEPEVARLRQAREDWVQEKLSLTNELAQLRPVDRALGELTEALTRLTERRSRSEHRQRSPLRSSARTASSPAHSDGSDDDDSLDGVNTSSVKHSDSTRTRPLAQRSVTESSQHAAWIGIPALRQLSPELYSVIRTLFNDLNRKENDCKELERTLEAQRHESAVGRERLEGDLEKDHHVIASLRQQIENLRQELAALEQEVQQLHSARTTTEQIKAVVRSFPAASWESDAFPSVSIDNQHLPEVISKALTQNSAAVVNLNEANQTIAEQKIELAHFRRLETSLGAENYELKATLDQLKNQLKTLESDFNMKEKQLNDELDSAVDLVEKQNTLTLSLEAKLESLKRERQLKAAQLASMQQREDAMAMRLAASLKSIISKSGIAAIALPLDSARLNELIPATTEIFSKILDLRSTGYASAATISTVPLRETSNYSGTGGLPCDGVYNDTLGFSFPSQPSQQQQHHHQQQQSQAAASSRFSSTQPHSQMYNTKGQPSVNFHPPAPPAVPVEDGQKRRHRLRKAEMAYAAMSDSHQSEK